MVKLGELLEEFDQRLGERQEPEILTLTEKMGFISQLERFSKRLAIADTSNYKLIGLTDIAFNPYLLWAGAVAQNTGWEAAIISPLYPTFHVRKGYSARYVNYLLCSGFLRSRYGAISFGSVPRKRRAAVKDFLDLRIPQQPSLTTQERMVKLLDKADELRKLRAQADRRTADLIPSLFHEMFGDPFTNPKGCSVVRIDEAGRVQLGRQRAPKYQTGKFARPYVRVANVYEDEIDVDDLLSMDFDERDFAKYRLEHGDILLNEGQSTELGRVNTNGHFYAILRTWKSPTHSIAKSSRVCRRNAAT